MAKSSYFYTKKIIADDWIKGEMQKPAEPQQGAVSAFQMLNQYEPFA